MSKLGGHGMMAPASYKIIHCTHERHANAILAILNEAIVSSTALYDYQPRTLESMDSWFKTKQAGTFPVLGVEDTDGELLGFGTYGAFRAFPAFKYTAEHSVYVHKAHRGRGLGLALMKALMRKAKDADLHSLIAVIDSSNLPSIAMHQKLGFQLAGTLPQVGFKFARWLDVVLYQMVFETPAHPEER